MNKHRVLIVQNDPTSAGKLAQILEAGGYNTAIAGQGNHLCTESGQPDAIFIDAMDKASAKACADARCPVIQILAENASSATPLAVHNPFIPQEVLAVLKLALHYEPKTAVPGFGAILSIFPGIAVLVDSAGCILDMNATAELHTRRSVRKAKGLSFTKLFTLLDIHSRDAVEGIDSIRSAGIEKGSLFIMKGSNGGENIVRVNCSHFGRPSGPERPMCLIIEDVSEAFTCATHSRCMDTALDIVSCSTVVTSAPADGTDPIITYCNRAFQNLSGWNADEIAGKPVSILTPSRESEHWTNMMDCLAASNDWHGEGTVQTKAGNTFEGTWTATCSKGCDGSPDAYIFAVQDNTHILRLEESLRQCQKIEAIGRLASGIAHDFNNLLSVINSYCDLQILKLDEDSPAMKYARQIRAAGRKGVDLVSQLMNFSRRERPNPTTLDLAQVVEEVKGMLRRVIREDIEMETLSREGTLPVKADQGQIEQILLNMCVNARDAMPNGGRLILEVFNRNYDKTFHSRNENIRPGHYVVMAISDTGCGMDEETQKRVFDPFFTTKEIGKGTGLGLATVQNIMRQYSGHILLKSRPGEGTRFELLFPAAECMEDRNECANPGLSPSPTGHEKIFIVEDDETFLDCISGLLRLQGYQVYTANDGGSAVRQLAEMNYEVDMLVSDLVLPKLSGREVAARLVEKNPEAKVLFMTGYDDQLDTFYSLPNDALILEKPFPLNAMLTKVRELLDESGNQ